MSLVNPDEQRSASVRALTVVEALVITRQEFDALLTQYPRLSFQLLQIVSRRLRAAENTTIRDLREKNRELSHAYQELKAAQEKLVEQEVLARELAQAQRIQLQMLPTTLPRVQDVDLGAAIRAARSVGGDFYEVIRLDADRVALAIGDVAGKGIPAALYMALASSLLRAEARLNVTPEAVVRRVNQHLCERDMDSMFVTLLYSELNLQTRRLRIVRAGHERRCCGLGSMPDRSSSTGVRCRWGWSTSRSSTFKSASCHLLPPWCCSQMVSWTPPTQTHALLARAASSNVWSAACTCRRRRCADAIVAAVFAHQGVAPQFDDVTVLALHLG